MPDQPTAPCSDLPTIIDVYPEDKRVRVQVPISDFNAQEHTITKGTDVAIVGWKRNGVPAPDAPRVLGRVKRVMVEVEVDLSTLERPQAEGQDSLL